MTTATGPKSEAKPAARKRNRRRQSGHAHSSAAGLAHAHTAPAKSPGNMAAALGALASAGHDLAAALREASGVRHAR